MTTSGATSFLKVHAFYRLTGMYSNLSSRRKLIGNPGLFFATPRSTLTQITSVPSGGWRTRGLPTKVR